MQTQEVIDLANLSSEIGLLTVTVPKVSQCMEGRKTEDSYKC